MIVYDYCVHVRVVYSNSSVSVQLMLFIQTIEFYGILYWIVYNHYICVLWSCVMVLMGTFAYQWSRGWKLIEWPPVNAPKDVRLDIKYSHSPFICKRQYMAPGQTVSPSKLRLHPLSMLLSSVSVTAGVPVQSCCLRHCVQLVLWPWLACVKDANAFPSATTRRFRNEI